MVQKRTLLIAILDDDPEFTEILSEILSEIFKSKGQPVEIQSFTQTGELDQSAQTYDLLFLDVELENENGVEWVSKWTKVRKFGEIIIVSSYENYVFASLKIRPFAFVRKRFLETDLQHAVQRYLSEQSDKMPVRVIVMDGKKQVLLDPQAISYIKANGHYLDIMAWDQTLFGIRNNLSKLQNVLQDYGFVRVQVSYLVNISFIEKVDNKSVYLKNGMVKTISPRYKEELLNRLRFYIKSDGDNKDGIFG